MADKSDIKQLQNKKLNICFVAPVPPPYGGIANWTSMVCHYLDQKYVESIEYMVLNTAPKQRVTEGRSLWNRIVGGGLDMLRQRNSLKMALRTDDINLVHMTTSGSLSIVRDFMLSRVAKRFEVPLIYHIHFGRIPEIQQKDNLEWKMVKAVIQNAKHIIAIDKKTYDTLSHIYREKVSYIPNPIDLESMPKIEQKPEKVVMYLGWVIKEKGIEELLEAWNDIYLVHGDWKLWIVGPYKEEYFAHLKKNYDMDGVRFWGEQPHGKAMELLNNSSVFVLPSYTEGCPYVIMEAMALGKPVIGTNVGNIPEMLSGGCGVVIRNANSILVESALFDLLMNYKNREAYGKRAMKKVKEEFSIERVVDLYYDCWENI